MGHFHSPRPRTFEQNYLPNKKTLHLESFALFNGNFVITAASHHPDKAIWFLVRPPRLKNKAGSHEFSFFDL